MSSRARREELRVQRAEEHRRAEAEYLANGGLARCGTCINGWRCPVNADDVMPCWVWGGAK